MLFSSAEASFPPPRRRVFFGSINDLHRSLHDDSLVVSAASGSRRRRLDDEYSVLDVARRRKIQESDDDDEANEEGNKLWPPWPFNLLTQGGRRNAQKSRDNDYPSKKSLFLSYFFQRMLVTKRQIQHVGSQLWFHLPPAGAPLILLSCIPQRRVISVEATGEMLVKMGPAFLVNGFVRSLVLASLGVAILSWSNAEVNRYRRMTTLPLPGQYQDIYRAILPHFLPEEVPDVDTEILRDMEKQVEDVPSPKVEDREAEGLSPRLRRHLQNIYQVAERKPRTLRTTFREWKRMRELRRLEEAKVRRASIMDELVALQALKKKALGRSKGRSTTNDTGDDSSENTLGYALVTGASRGIGRAIAVELARWEIPLILVARDVAKLTNLANDIELCYGVKCFVLPADLSEPDAAERIHKTTKQAGLDVDLLVSNAGVCSAGLSVDIPNSEIHKMMQINAVSVAMLNQLYGRDMKEKRRGRILVVSSIVGSVPSGPTVACYAATKAFERSLAMSMGKEMEPYGVGVTCLLPGAVRDTAFKSSSEVDEALCWKLPFYARPAPQVAHLGVVGMLEGSVQVVPGWQNRAFLKVFKPILPQRLLTMAVQMAWSPFNFSLPKPKMPSLPTIKNGKSNGKEKEPRVKALVDMPTTWPGSTARKAPPRMLSLPEKATTHQAESTEYKPLSIDKPEKPDLPDDIPSESLLEEPPIENASPTESTDPDERVDPSPDIPEETIKDKDSNGDGEVLPE